MEYNVRCREIVRHESKVTNIRLDMPEEDLGASREWDRKVEGFREHIGIDSSLKGTSGQRCSFCGQAVVDLDCDTEEEPCNAGTLKSAKTIKRDDLWAFTTAVAGLTGRSTIHNDRRCSIGGYGGRKKDVLGQSKNLRTCR